MTAKERQFICEEDNLQEAWYLEARQVTKETLLSFIDRLMDSYSHDMQTVCHAMVAIALAALAVANRYPEGQISTAQAQTVMTLFIRKWLNLSGPARLQVWEAALLEKNRDLFLGIPEAALRYLQGLAQQYLAQDLTGVEQEQVEHMRRIANGEAPYGLNVIQEGVE